MSSAIVANFSGEAKNPRRASPFDKMISLPSSERNAHAFESEPFEDGETGTLDFDAGAHEVAELVLGNPADAPGIGDEPVASDDGAEQQEHHD